MIGSERVYSYPILTAWARAMGKRVAANEQAKRRNICGEQIVQGYRLALGRSSAFMNSCQLMWQETKEELIT